MSTEIPPFRLYISVGRDLTEERELLGRSLTEIPVDIGWRINYSPTGNGLLKPELIGSVDLHLILLGGDIRAPVGQEYYLAKRSGRPLTALLKTGVNRTLAATDFVRFLRRRYHWQPFSDIQQLRLIFLNTILSILMKMEADLRLSKFEIEQLLSWRTELNQPSKEIGGEIRGGAGESSVILSVERFYPSEGIRLRDLKDIEEE